MKIYKIYTDGSCLNNGNNGTGGYCAIVLNSKDGELTIKGSQSDTTNNRMEMTAIIQGLKVVPRHSIVDIYSDSEFIVKTIRGWLKKWIQKGFKKKANVDLWQEYIEVSKNLHINAHWVKAHSGNYYNERCDHIAKEEALKLKGKLQ